MINVVNAGSTARSNPLTPLLRFFPTIGKENSFKLSKVKNHPSESIIEETTAINRFNQIKNLNIDSPDLIALINTFNHDMFPWKIDFTLNETEYYDINSPGFKQLEATQKMAQSLGLEVDFERACGEADTGNSAKPLEDFSEKLMNRWFEQWKKTNIERIVRSSQFEEFQRAIHLADQDKAQSTNIEVLVKPMFIAFFTELASFGAKLSELDIQHLAQKGCDASRNDINKEIDTHFSKNTPRSSSV